MYRVTIQVVSHLPFESKTKDVASYWNRTLALMSTEGWTQPEWSSCRWRSWSMRELWQWMPTAHWPRWYAPKDESEQKVSFYNGRLVVNFIRIVWQKLSCGNPHYYGILQLSIYLPIEILCQLERDSAMNNCQLGGVPELCSILPRRFIAIFWDTSQRNHKTYHDTAKAESSRQSTALFWRLGSTLERFWS